MSNVNDILPKLLRHALAECPCGELGCRERASGYIPPQGGCRSCEDQHAPLATLDALVVALYGDLIHLESCNGLMRKRKRGDDVGVHALLHLLQCQGQERLPHAEPGVEQRAADLVGFPAVFGVEAGSVRLEDCEGTCNG